MANRIRNERLEIKLTKEEKALFEEKKRLAKCRNMSRLDIYQSKNNRRRLY